MKFVYIVAQRKIGSKKNHFDASDCVRDAAIGLTFFRLGVYTIAIYAADDGAYLLIFRSSRERDESRTKELQW